jgi:acetoacetate decarboxylase
MGLVRTAEEIERIQATFANPRFVSAEMLTVDFLTQPETVAHVLPPPLEPAAEPRVTAMVGRWQSNCVGDFTGGALYVAARFGEIEADYVLAMYMDTFESIAFGRELFGEPKKQAATRLHRRGSHAVGHVERHGVRLIELEAELGENTGPVQVKGANFNVKALPATDGVGLEDDAVLTLAEFDNPLDVVREGTGTVRLRGTVHDPLDELEIVEVLRATYIEGDLISRARSLIRIPAEDFLPYALGRMDDWSALDTEHASIAQVAGDIVFGPSGPLVLDPPLPTHDG